MPEIIAPSATLAEALSRALDAACAHDPNALAPPACIVWTDEPSEWAPLLDRLRPHWPHLLTLGGYDPDARTGPAIWLRAALGGDLPEVDLGDALPIVYLPGVGRSQLRAVASLPRPLQPLAELQYRGALFSQVNGRDWTALAFLASAEGGGLGLDVARDAGTSEALLRALPALADRPVADLAGRRLEAADFNALLAPDPARDLLRWLNDPEGVRESAEAGVWAAFRAVCRDTFQFAPEADGPLGAAEKLGSQSGAWAAVWDRFAEAPHLYPAIPERLAQARPTSTNDLFGGTVREAWPQDNAAEEETLRASLLSLGTVTAARAAEQIRTLEERHGVRRSWVWATLDQAPLAGALERLVALAEAAQQPVAGPTPQACADAYLADGWRADDAFLTALACVATGPDGEAVRTAAVALYRPWLDATAQAFETALGGALPPQSGVEGEVATPGTAWLFVDALRYDIGQRLADTLEAGGGEVERSATWAAFPSITATAKPACSPVADGVRGGAAMHEFAPETEDEQPLTTHRFRALVKDRGIQVLESGATGDPSGSAWAEIGTIDTKGHDDGWSLACRLGELLDDVAARVRGLLDAGWREVRVVTDHGWLLLPGGLPKSDLPKALTTAKWARAAELVPGSQTPLPTHGWFWNDAVRVAVAPTIHAFAMNVEYAHGGLTLQECVVPRLVVTAGTAPVSGARIVAAEWRGLRCRVEANAEADGLTVDLRLRPADATSSVAAALKSVADGDASLIVPDDTLEGSAAVVVLLDSTNRVVHRLSTVIGG